MITTIFFFILIVALAFLSYQHYRMYKEKVQQNNDTAVRNRNLALITAILCIILLTALVANKDEFFSINHFKQCSMKENQMQSNAFGTGQSNGLTEPTQGVFFKT